MTTTTNVTSHESTLNDNAAYYVFHSDRLEKNIDSMKRAFTKLYENFQIAYSFKTNYLKRICRIIAANDCMAEVVSPYEFKYALGLGCFKPSKVVYNGVIPDPHAKYGVAACGGIVNVDNYGEYKMLSDLAKMNRTKIAIGVRVNFPIGNSLVSRFGVDIEGAEFSELMAAIDMDPYVTLKGFHCHIGTSRPAKYWREKAEVMVSLAKKHDVEYLDFGGGMYGPMIHELADQFTDYAASFDDYAEAVCPVMKEAFPDERVKLIVEPGTALVGNTMDLYAHVTDIKDVRGKKYVTLDTCSNHLGMICECRVIPMHVINPNTDLEPLHDACISGCTCLEFDYIRKSFDGHINVGDVVVFENVGAYSIGASRQFIVPRPAVICADTGAILRPAETADDMFCNYLAL